MNKCFMILWSAVFSLGLAGCGFQMVGNGLADAYDGYRLQASASSKVGRRLERELRDAGMRSGGEQQINFEILREAFSSRRSLASKAATTAEIQLNLTVHAMIRHAARLLSNQFHRSTFESRPAKQPRRLSGRRGGAPLDRIGRQPRVALTRRSRVWRRPSII